MRDLMTAARSYIAVTGTPEQVAAQLTRLKDDRRMIWDTDGHPHVTAPAMGADGTVVIFVLCFEEE